MEITCKCGYHGSDVVTLISRTASRTDMNIALGYPRYNERQPHYKPTKETQNWVCPACGRLLVQFRHYNAYTPPTIEQVMHRLLRKSIENERAARGKTK